MPAHTHDGVPSMVADTDRGTMNSSLFSIDTLGETGPTGGGIDPGEGDAHENRPPYYTLAFIIKL